MAYAKVQFVNGEVKQLVAPSLHYQTVYLHSGSGIIYIGDDTSVAIGTGYRMDNGDKLVYSITPGEGLWGIAATGSPYMYVMNNQN